ncbi:COMM domain-containing protein 1-like [Dysidea avara]|uniref:COMM domain-containing protein 1-like n=1 Tax=Dysidea avara TaxID=196820 RepID=UPI00331A34A0
MAAPAAVDKTLLAFLNGIAKRVYFKDDSISDELLRTEVLGGISETEFNQKLRRFQLLLNSIATADMNYNQLDAFLKSQMQKREGALTASEAATITKFWQSHKSKIHDTLVKDSTWDNQMKSLNWRIDVCTKARHLDQLNQPTAIVEMKLEQGDLIRFELTQQKLEGLLEQVDAIEQAITTHSQS